jgi:hypothetical protein
MNHNQNRPIRLAAGAVVLSFTAMLMTMPVTIAQSQELPEETHDGLSLVPDRKVGSAYIDSDADFSIYNKIMILDCYVAFRKDWERDTRRTGSRMRISSKDVQEIKDGVAEMFRDVFSETLSEDGGYEIVDTPGDDVLLVRPAIIDLDVVAPDTDAAARSRSYTTTSGAATIYLELYDSVTSDILARAADRNITRSPGGHLSYTTSTSNRADARRALRGWANLLREKLDEFHGK